MMVKLGTKKRIRIVRKIGKRHGLKPSILRDVMEGRIYGLSYRVTSKIYGHSKNTISKYSQKIDEMDDYELSQLAIIIGVSIGGSGILNDVLEESMNG